MTILKLLLTLFLFLPSRGEARRLFFEDSEKPVVIIDDGVDVSFSDHDNIANYLIHVVDENLITTIPPASVIINDIEVKASKLSLDLARALSLQDKGQILLRIKKLRTDKSLEENLLFSYKPTAEIRLRNSRKTFDVILNFVPPSTSGLAVTITPTGSAVTNADFAVTRSRRVPSGWQVQITLDNNIDTDTEVEIVCSGLSDPFGIDVKATKKEVNFETAGDGKDGSQFYAKGSLATDFESGKDKVFDLDLKIAPRTPLNANWDVIFPTIEAEVGVNSSESPDKVIYSAALEHGHYNPAKDAKVRGVFVPLRFAFETNRDHQILNVVPGGTIRLLLPKLYKPLEVRPKADQWGAQLVPSIGFEGGRRFAVRDSLLSGYQPNAMYPTHQSAIDAIESQNLARTLGELEFKLEKRDRFSISATLTARNLWYEEIAVVSENKTTRLETFDKDLVAYLEAKLEIPLAGGATSITADYKLGRQPPRYSKSNQLTVGLTYQVK